MDGSENCSLVRWNPAAAPPRGVDKDAASSSPAVPRSREEISLLSANLLSSMRKSVRAHCPVRGRATSVLLDNVAKGPPRPPQPVCRHYDSFHPICRFLSIASYARSPAFTAPNRVGHTHTNYAVEYTETFVSYLRHAARESEVLLASAPPPSEPERAALARNRV